MKDESLPTISVVIPTLDEAARVGACVASVSGSDVEEVIVADGGSSDATARCAEAAGATVLRAPRGRARQMNAGAAAAGGDVLLFLHADCTLAPGALRRLRRLLAAGRHGAGYFRQRIDGRHPLYRLIELGSNLRARWLARPYGDQAMFFRRRVFERVGGFPDVPIMEDLRIARAAQRLGPFLPVPEVLTYSARRWRKNGLVRTIARNWRLAAAEGLGHSPDRLLDRYEAQKRIARGRTDTQT